MDLTVVDVEAADSDYASLCQIGLVRVTGGVITDQKCFLVNPEDYFSPVNISIHGITAETVANHPTFVNLWPDLSDHFGRQFVVPHGSFDRTAVARALSKYELPPPSPLRGWIPCAWFGVSGPNSSGDPDTGWLIFATSWRSRWTGIMTRWRMLWRRPTFCS